MRDYAAPLAAIPAVCTFIGSTMVGSSFFLFRYRTPIVTAFTFLVLLLFCLGSSTRTGTARSVTAGTDVFRVLFFVLTFFTIGVVSNFRKLREEGIGRLAAVYLVCLFGFIIWIGLLISWLFFHGMRPPLATG